MSRQHQWTRTTVRLAQGGLLGIDDGRGLRLRVASGAVWLTQQDDGRDVVLREGESFVIDRPAAASASSTKVNRIRIASARSMSTPFRGNVIVYRLCPCEAATQVAVSGENRG